MIRGDVFLDSVPSSTEGQANQQLLGQLTALGVDSIHIRRGVELEEFLAVAEFLWQFSGSGDGVAAAARRAQRPAHQPRQADPARHPLAHAAVARCADDAARPGLRGVDPPRAADVRGHRRRQADRRRDGARPGAGADPQGRAQQRRARTDPRRQAVREPHLLPLGERVGAQPAARQAGRAGRGDAGRAGRSRAAARRRQDADSAGDRQEGRARSTSTNGRRSSRTRRSAPRSSCRRRACIR